MRRRDFIKGIAGAAATWPLAARALQPGSLPRFIFQANDFPDVPEARARHAAFREAFEKLGWVDGRNIRIEDHWGFVPPARVPAVAAELVRSPPTIIMTSSSATSEALQRASKRLPVVFVAATDPRGSGLVARMARLGGNLTGFANYVASIGAKWLELLREAFPSIRRVPVIMGPNNIW